MATLYWLLIILSSLIASTSAISGRLVFLASFDGFRRDFLKLGLTPNLQSMYRKGVEATNMWNQFPTKTRVNHFSIGTGLTPQSHGVTGNEVFDRDKKKLIGYSYALFHWNGKVVPIWTLNELQKGKTGAMMWAATEFKYRNRNVSFHKKLNKDISFEKRIDGAIDWFKKGANFVMMYFDQPDRHGHGYGPESQKQRDMVKKVDDAVGYLNWALQAAGLHKKTDVIILSDHGMVTVKPRNFVNLNRWMDKKHCKVYGKSPVVQVVCKQGTNNQNCQKLDANGKKLKAFRAYQNEHLPKRWRFRNARTGPCTVVAQPGFGFWDMWKSANGASAKTHIPVTKDTTYGSHGYDPAVTRMRPIFIAQGPSFKSNVRINNKFSNIDLYYLFCKILGLRPISKIDGTNRKDIWRRMLKY